MIESPNFWSLVQDFMDVIHNETGFPVLIYDTDGFIIRATDQTRIGDLHAGAKKIMQGHAEEYSVTEQEATSNPLVREGHSCPIYLNDKLVAGFGITGKLELAKPLAKIAANMISSWIKVHTYQEQLARSERKYRSIFDHSIHGIFQSSLDGKLQMVNRAAAEILGYPSTEVLVSTVTDAATQLWASQTERKRYVELLTTKRRVSKFVSKFKKGDGEIIDVTLNATLLHDPDTGVPYIQGIVEDITEIKRAEELIRQSEEKYSKAFNNSPVWVVLSSLDTGRLIEVNETFLRTLGYSREEVIGRTSSELGVWVNPDDRKCMIEIIKSEGKIHNLEVQRRAKDGNILTMLFHAELINIAGEPCLLSVSLDISDRKKMEENLRVNENNLRITLNSIGDAVIATNTDSIITRMNPTAEKLTGWTAKDAIGRPLPEVFCIVNAFTGEKELNPAQKVLAHGRTEELANHTVLINKNGGRLQIADSGAPIRRSDGEIEGVVLVFRDVTEAYKQANTIKENERLLNNITANIPGVVFQLQVLPEKQFIMRYVSQKFASLFGINPHDDDLFATFSQHIHNDDKASFLKTIIQAARSSIPWQFEGRFVKANSTEIWFSGNAIPQLVNNQLVFFGVLLDITDRKSAEIDAEHLKTALAQAQKMEAIGTLAGGIAHDFNNILTAVVGYSQLSLLKPCLDDSLRENLNHIMNAGIRARDLVGQILTFSRQKKLELIPLQLGPLIKESIKLLRASLPATIEIIEQISNDISNVMADPTQVHQIIMNLSTNAAQAIENHNGTILIRLSQVELQENELKNAPDQRPGTYVKLDIEDSGQGIPSEVIDRIFEPYFTTKGIDKGTGLGLSVVHGIVKGYNGAIDVTSEPGLSTRFSIYLPAISRPSTEIKKPFFPIPTGSETIMLIDDEIDVLNVGQQMLKNLGYSVIIYNDPFAALEYYQASADSVDLVITDLTMPKMAGVELAQKLLTLNKNLPIIFWSGYSSAISQEKIETGQAKGFLFKPILPGDLGNLVRKVLDDTVN